MKKSFRLSTLILSVILIFSLAACSNADSESSTESGEEQKPSAITVEDVTVRSAQVARDNYGTLSDKLSLTPLTDSASFTVKNAMNYGWITYDNYTLAQKYDKGTVFPKAGFLFYLELDKREFSHEMFFEFFDDYEKLNDYSGDVAYLDDAKTCYILELGDAAWRSVTTENYRLCFNDNGKEFKGYVFIPMSAVFFRREAVTLTNIGIYVKTGSYAKDGAQSGDMTFTVSSVMPVSYFDNTKVIAAASNKSVDLSSNKIVE